MVSRQFLLNIVVEKKKENAGYITTEKRELRFVEQSMGMIAVWLLPSASCRLKYQALAYYAVRLAEKVGRHTDRSWSCDDRRQR
jgi:hypothetical protein